MRSGGEPGETDRELSGTSRVEVLGTKMADRPTTRQVRRLHSDRRPPGRFRLETFTLHVGTEDQLNSYKSSSDPDELVENISIKETDVRNIMTGTKG